LAACDGGSIFRIDVRLQGPYSRICERSRNYRPQRSKPSVSSSVDEQVHLLAKQFNFVAQPGVLFWQLLTFSKKLVSARSFYCLAKQAGGMSKYKH
jgi:hypothetical protein